MGSDLSRPFGTRALSASDPALKTLGYSRLSLRDSKAALLSRRQNSPRVQTYDLWLMTSPQERGKRPQFPGIFTPFGVALLYGDSRRWD